MGGAFRAVPPELLRRVLGLLSAHDLSAAVSVTCRGLRAAAADNILWRRLYKARCGRLGSASALHGSLLQWEQRPAPGYLLETPEAVRLSRWGTKAYEEGVRGWNKQLSWKVTPTA